MNLIDVKINLNIYLFSGRRSSSLSKRHQHQVPVPTPASVPGPTGPGASGSASGGTAKPHHYGGMSGQESDNASSTGGSTSKTQNEEGTQSTALSMSVFR